MKRLLLPLAAAAMMSAGCAHQYVMKLTNGTQISTPSKPKLKGANYYYKDALGRENVMPQSRVMEVEPASFVEEEKKSQQPVYHKPKRHWWQFWRSSA
jgi:hypothetical protein